MPAMEPSNKRKRDDLPRCEAEGPTLVRSDIWFDDGSIVIQAENTLFRVHRSMLSRHSTVFSDMSAVPLPVNEPLIEGCPVAHLTDSAADVGHLLMALYDKNYNVRGMLPFPVIAALLRLGRKYDFEHLRDEALLRLTAEFPMSLEEWEKLPPEYTHIKYQNGILFDIINLALENSVHSILPVAYYLTLQNVEEILYGEKRDDGTVAHLPHSVQKACIMGREKIVIALEEHTFGWLDEEEINSSCANPTQCGKARMDLIRVIWKPMPDSSRSLEKWSQALSSGLCGLCAEVAHAIHQEGRKKIWDMMPSFFQLPPWNELINFDI